MPVKKQRQVLFHQYRRITECSLSLMIRHAAALLEGADLFRNFHDDGRNRRNARCGLQFRTMHIRQKQTRRRLGNRNLVYNSEFPADAVLFHNGNPLLPLDGCGRFGGDVVDYAVDPLDLVDDVVRHVGQELVGPVSYTHLTLPTKLEV